MSYIMSKRLGSFDDSQQKKTEPVYCCTYFIIQLYSCTILVDNANSV